MAFGPQHSGRVRIPKLESERRVSAEDGRDAADEADDGEDPAEVLADHWNLRAVA